jgi:hypothetical protein
MPFFKLRNITALSFVLLLAAHDSWGQARALRRMESRTRPGEIDTAAAGGQAGGRQIGRSYKLVELRCAAGEVIAGARIRRGAVLDHLQIACARPRCDGRGCQWTSYSWGMSAGDSAGGEPHPPMICSPNEMVSGFRARTVSFTVFDYASDIEFECTPVASRPTSEGFFPAGEGNTWHHPEGGFQVEFAPEGAKGLRRTPDNISPFISCRTRGFGATAVSVGEADFVRRGQRVVQAVSLFCPDGTRPATAGPDAETLLNTMDRCLREQGNIAYYSSPNRRPYSGGATYERSTTTILYDPGYLNRQPPYTRALALADAFASHLLTIQRGRPPVLSADHIMGFVMHCAWFTDSAFRDEPRDPRLWFCEYRGVRWGSCSTDEFDRGWWSQGMGLKSRYGENVEEY